MKRLTRGAAWTAALTLLVSATTVDHRVSVSAQAQGQRPARDDRERDGNDNGIDRRMSGFGRLAKMAAQGRLDKMIERERRRREHKPSPEEEERNVPGPLEGDEAVQRLSRVGEER